MNDMSSAIEDLRSIHPGLAGMRRLTRYALASGGLVLLLISYCELCSLVRGLPAPGLSISAPWAFQVSIPWIAVGTAFALFANRIADGRLASLYPRAVLGAVILAGAASALVLEALLMKLLGGESPLPLFLYQRAPTHIAATALLVAIYLAHRLWNVNHRATRPAVIAAAVSEQPECIEAPSASLPATDTVDCIEVMTGTGRTSIRVSDIECLQADRNYINVIHVSGRTYLLRQTMAAAQRALDENHFMRVHRSTIVNCRMIKERRTGGVLVLQSGRTVTVSRAYREQLRH